MMPDDIVLLAHGGGGSRTQELLREHILPALRNPVLDQMDDAAVVPMNGMDLVLTTDSYVVRPLFFPGGDIGRLAICGTVNDIAMQGGVPRYLTLGLIIEEGLPIADLRRAIASAAVAASEAGVLIAAGDTKVIEHRGGGGLFINTAGIGVRRPGVDTHVRNARPGDAVLVSGTIGDHGIAVMTAREGLGLQAPVASDTAPLNRMVGALFDSGITIHCLRDPTRGGIAAALNDIAAAAGVGIAVDQRAIPVLPAVRGACDLLGFDPLEVANEGKAIVVCPRDFSDRVLEMLRRDPLGRSAAAIGEVVASHPGIVTLRTSAGGERIVSVPDGSDLPRIC